MRGDGFLKNIFEGENDRIQKINENDGWLDCAEILAKIKNPL